MRAIRWHGRDDVRLDEVPSPGDPGRAEVLLQVLLCGICGTDIEELRRGPITIPVDVPNALTGQVAPLVLGHEIVGRVIARGADVDALALGDRVVPDGIITCGTCISCRTGRRHLCASVANIGLHRDGGMADQLRVPAAMCIVVPKEVPDRAAVLAEPLAVAVRAVRRAGVETGDRVLVIGVGAVGQCVLQLVALRGAAPGAADPDPWRRGATIDAVAGLVIAETGSQHPWAGEADCVIDCAGSEDSLRDALDAVRPGGRIVLVGATSSGSAFSPHDLLAREATIITSLSHDLEMDTRAAVRLLAAGVLSVDHVVTSVLSFEAAVQRVFRPVDPGSGIPGGRGPSGLKTAVDPALARGSVA